jgi:division protein CdvB (Snf7/Vps24/ESCRT-III family)
MQLSNQAAGALLMVLQKCLWEQIDIMDLLNDMVFEMSDDGLVVTNPPVVSGDLSELEEAVNAED